MDKRVDRDGMMEQNKNRLLSVRINKRLMGTRAEGGSITGGRRTKSNKKL